MIVIYIYIYTYGGRERERERERASERERERGVLSHRGTPCDHWWIFQESIQRGAAQELFLLVIQDPVVQDLGPWVDSIWDHLHLMEVQWWFNGYLMEV